MGRPLRLLAWAALLLASSSTLLYAQAIYYVDSGDCIQVSFPECPVFHPTDPIRFPFRSRAGETLDMPKGKPLCFYYYGKGLVYYTDLSGDSQYWNPQGCGDASGIEVISGKVKVTAEAPGISIPILFGGGVPLVSVKTSNVGKTGSFVIHQEKQGSTQKLYVQSGVIDLSLNWANSYFEWGKQVDYVVFQGETATLSVPRGELQEIIIGSPDASGVPGDPLAIPELSGEITIPRLDGALERLDGKSLLDILSGALAEKLGVSKGEIAYDDKNGAFVFQTSGEYLRLTALGKVQVLFGALTVDDYSASKKPIPTSGAFSASSQGILFTLTGAPGSYGDFLNAIKSLDSSAKINLRSNGVFEFQINGGKFLATPEISLHPAPAATNEPSGLESYAKGFVVYRDPAGRRQTLYPALLDFDAFSQMLAYFVEASATDNRDGSLTLEWAAERYRLWPGYALLPIPKSHLIDLWWLDGSTIYVHFPEYGAQGLSVR